MTNILTLEKHFKDINRLIIDDFERISRIWNDTQLNLEKYIKNKSKEKMQNQMLIDKGFQLIKQMLSKIKGDEKYLKYYQNMKASYIKAKNNLEKANALKELSLHKTNSFEIASSYLAPFLGYLTEVSEYTENFNEKSYMLSKIAWLYHRKALTLQKKLEFKAMSNIAYAKKLYLQAWELNRKNYDTVHGLAKCMYKLSKFKNCIEFLTEEYKIEEEKRLIKDYHRILAICYRKTNDYSEAYKEIRNALEYEPNNYKLTKEKLLIEKLIEKKKTEKYENILFAMEDIKKFKYEEQDYVYRHVESKEFRILSIDGGGIRGIVPAYWACEIEKRAHKPIAHLFNMLAGTSTGGIISAGLSYPDTDEYSPKYRAYELLDIYRHRGTEIFPTYNWIMGKLNVVMSIVGSKYDDRGRKDLFEELLGKARICSSLTELVIPAANEEYILSTHLFNRFDARYDEMYNDYYVDALMSTSAAPYYFPSYEIKNKGFFLDGGVHVNNPAGVACAEAKRYGVSHNDIHLVSMGTGAYVPGLLDESSWRSMLFSTETNLKNRGALYWAAHLKDVSLEAQCGNTDIAMYESLGSKYKRMQVWFENAITLDQVDENNINLLTDIASQYIEEADISEGNSFNKLIEKLVKDKEF